MSSAISADKRRFAFRCLCDAERSTLKLQLQEIDTHGAYPQPTASPASDQRAAIADFRRIWQEALAGRDYELQRQPFDHVLREDQRRQGAFDVVAQYVLENPVRAGLVTDWKSYPFSGAVVPGYPEMEPRDPAYWERFWRLYAYVVARNFGHER